MPFNPHTPKDVGDMLAAIGAKSIDQLFDEIPKELRIESLAGIPDALNEMQIGRLMTARAAQDGLPLNFIGAGAYEHHIPSAVWAVTTRGDSPRSVTFRRLNAPGAPSAASSRAAEKRTVHRW